MGFLNRLPARQDGYYNRNRMWKNKGRGKYAFKHAFTTGKVAGPVSPYFTAFANSCYESPGMADLTSKIIYFATDSAGDVIEMRVWS
jgi:hypothetical protein